jgi:transcriptional regulator with XRE-family HTH domain
MQVEGSLRKWRLVRNFKQAYLAQALGMSQQNYQKIETGKTKLEIGVAERLAELLEVKLEDIYTSPALAPPPDTKEMISLYERLLQEKEQRINELRELLNFVLGKKTSLNNKKK